MGGVSAQVVSDWLAALPSSCCSSNSYCLKRVGNCGTSTRTTLTGWRRGEPMTLSFSTLPPKDSAAHGALLTCSGEARPRTEAWIRRPSWCYPPAGPGRDPSIPRTLKYRPKKRPPLVGRLRVRRLFWWSGCLGVCRTAAGPTVLLHAPRRGSQRTARLYTL